MARMCASVNVLSTRRAAVPAGAEGDALARVARVGPVRVIGVLERGDVDQDVVGRRLTRQGMDRHHECRPRAIDAGHGSAFQISLAYCRDGAVAGELAGMATLRIAVRVQARVEVERHRLLLRCHVGGKVGQVHVVVAARQAACPRSARRSPARPRLKASEAIRSRAAAGLGLVLVVPAGVVPAAAVGDLLGGQAEQEEVLLAGLLRPSRSSRRRGCRRSAPRSS